MFCLIPTLSLSTLSCEFRSHRAGSQLKIDKSAKRKLGLIYEETSIINSPSKRTNLKAASSNIKIVPKHANELQSDTSGVEEIGPGSLTKSPSKLVSSAVDKVQGK